MTIRSKSETAVAVPPPSGFQALFACSSISAIHSRRNLSLPDRGNSGGAGNLRGDGQMYWVLGDDWAGVPRADVVEREHLGVDLLRK